MYIYQANTEHARAKTCGRKFMILDTQFHNSSNKEVKQNRSSDNVNSDKKNKKTNRECGQVLREGGGGPPAEQKQRCYYTMKMKAFPFTPTFYNIQQLNGIFLPLKYNQSDVKYPSII